LAAFKFDYEHLVNVEIPENAREIATARSYGDLRENAEYQMAKEKQHTLISKQEQMNRTLRLLKATDFASATTEKVQMGTSVTINLNGQTLTYTILGELDSDEALNIISCRSRLAEALLNKTAGEEVVIPTVNGPAKAKIVTIAPINDAVKAWLAAIPTA
jgi:transcription elongation GreA/GreB family factor